MRKGLLPALAPVVAAVLVIFGVIALGRQAADALRDNERYSLAFADIDCAPPPETSRDDFLLDVQRLASWPDRLSALQEDLPARLASAFAMHPWVESVERVEVKQPRQVRVRLIYREPVLSVLGSNRAVDRHAVLLPLTARAAELPALSASIKLPDGLISGKGWSNPLVEAAAATAAFLRPYNDRLRLQRYEFVEGELVLAAETIRVHWGHAPEKESAGEATADVKLQRLLDYRTEHGSLSGINGETMFDVRPLAGAVHRP